MVDPPLGLVEVVYQYSVCFGSVKGLIRPVIRAADIVVRTEIPRRKASSLLRWQRRGSPCPLCDVVQSAWGRAELHQASGTSHHPSDTGEYHDNDYEAQRVAYLFRQAIRSCSAFVIHRHGSSLLL
jgi:hypothetical protein